MLGSHKLSGFYENLIFASCKIFISETEVRDVLIIINYFASQIESFRVSIFGRSQLDIIAAPDRLIVTVVSSVSCSLSVSVADYWRYGKSSLLTVSMQGVKVNNAPGEFIHNHNHDNFY